MLFQNTIENIDNEIAELLAQIEAKKQQQAQLTELDALTDSTLEQLGNVVSKFEHYAPEAIASLKLAVLTLFESGDNGNDGGNQPIDPNPTPEPDDDEPELLCFNGVTGEALTTGDKDDEELPVDDPIGNEWILPSEAPLTGQSCAFNPELYWEVTPPDGSSWEFASPLACLLWEDAPKLGQHCTITPSTSTDNENKGTTGEGEHMPYIELVTHPENEALAYQRKHDGEIVCCYIGFTAKARAQSWQLFVETMTDRVELRPATRMSAFKYELKIKGLSPTQIDRLARECDVTKSYHKPWNGESKPPSYKEEAPRLPINPDEVKPGDIVTPLLTPGDSYEVIQVMPNGILDCKSLRTGVQMGMRSTAVTRVQKGKKSLTQYAKILLKDCEHEGQTLPVLQASQGGIGYTVSLPNGDNHWFRADCVQIVDAEIEENALPTEPVDTELTLDQRVAAMQKRREEFWAKNGTIAPSQWKELQALAKNGGLTQEQLGEIALIPYGYRRGGEIKVSQFDEIRKKLEAAEPKLVAAADDASDF